MDSDYKEEYDQCNPRPGKNSWGYIYLKPTRGFVEGGELVYNWPGKSILEFEKTSPNNKRIQKLARASRIRAWSIHKMVKYKTELYQFSKKDDTESEHLKCLKRVKSLKPVKPIKPDKKRFKKGFLEFKRIYLGFLSCSKNMEAAYKLRIKI